MRGRGAAAASFSRNADGSKYSARVPSRHGRFSRNRALPSGVSSTASCATGGRRGIFTYRTNDEGKITNLRRYWNMASMEFEQAS